MCGTKKGNLKKVDFICKILPPKRPRRVKEDNCTIIGNFIKRKELHTNPFLFVAYDQAGSIPKCTLHQICAMRDEFISDKAEWFQVKAICM